MPDISNEFMADDQIGDLLADLAPDDEDMAQLHAMGSNCGAQTLDPWLSSPDARGDLLSPLLVGQIVDSPPVQKSQALHTHFARLGSCQEHAEVETRPSQPGLGVVSCGKVAGLLDRWVDSDCCTETASEEADLLTEAAACVDGDQVPMSDDRSMAFNGHDGKYEATLPSARSPGKALKILRPPQKLRIKRKQQRSGQGDGGLWSDGAQNSRRQICILPDGRGCDGDVPVDPLRRTRGSCRVTQRIHHSSPTPEQTCSTHLPSFAQSNLSEAEGEQADGEREPAQRPRLGSAAIVAGTSETKHRAPRKWRLRIPRRQPAHQEAPPTKPLLPPATTPTRASQEATTSSVLLTPEKESAPHVGRSKRLCVPHDEPAGVPADASEKLAALCSGNGRGIVMAPPQAMPSASMVSASADSATVTHDEQVANDAPDDNASSHPPPPLTNACGDACLKLSEVDSQTNSAAQRNPFKRIRPFCASQHSRQLLGPAIPKSPAVTTWSPGNAATSTRQRLQATSSFSARSKSVSGQGAAVHGCAKLQCDPWKAMTKTYSSVGAPSACSNGMPPQTTSYPRELQAVAAISQGVNRTCGMRRPAAKQPLQQMLSSGRIVQPLQARRQDGKMSAQLLRASRATFLHSSRALPSPQQLIGRAPGPEAHSPEVIVPSVPQLQRPLHPCRLNWQNSQLPHCGVSMCGGQQPRVKPSDPRLAHRVTSQHQTTSQAFAPTAQTVLAKQTSPLIDNARATPRCPALPVGRSVPQSLHSACLPPAPPQQAHLASSLSDLLEAIKRAPSSSPTKKTPPTEIRVDCHLTAREPVHLSIPHNQVAPHSKQARHAVSCSPSEVVPGDGLEKLLQLMRGNAVNSSAQDAGGSAFKAATDMALHPPQENAEVAAEREPFKSKPGGLASLIQQMAGELKATDLADLAAVASCDEDDIVSQMDACDSTRGAPPSPQRQHLPHLGKQGTPRMVSAVGIEAGDRQRASSLVQPRNGMVSSHRYAGAPDAPRAKSPMAGPALALHPPPAPPHLQHVRKPSQQVLNITETESNGARKPSDHDTCDFEPPGCTAKGPLATRVSASDSADQQDVPKSTCRPQGAEPMRPRGEQEAGGSIGAVRCQEDCCGSAVASQEASSSPGTPPLLPPPPRTVSMHHPGIDSAARIGLSATPCIIVDTEAPLSSKHTFRPTDAVSSHSSPTGTADCNSPQERHCSGSSSSGSHLRMHSIACLSLHSSESFSLRKDEKQGACSSGTALAEPRPSQDQDSSGRAHDNASLLRMDDNVQMKGRAHSIPVNARAWHGKAAHSCEDDTEGMQDKGARACHSLAQGHSSHRVSECNAEQHKSEAGRAGMAHSRQCGHSENVTAPHKLSRSNESDECGPSRRTHSQGCRHTAGREQHAEPHCCFHNKRQSNCMCQEEGRCAKHQAGSKYACSHAGKHKHEQPSQKPGAPSRSLERCCYMSAHCRCDRSCGPSSGRCCCKRATGKRPPSERELSRRWTLECEHSHYGGQRRHDNQGRNEHDMGYSRMRDSQRFDDRLHAQKARVMSKSGKARAPYSAGKARAQIDSASSNGLPGVGELFGC
jgi:hypothetical protein